jgi:hypothetical protein
MPELKSSEKALKFLTAPTSSLEDLLVIELKKVHEDYSDPARAREKTGVCYFQLEIFVTQRSSSD